MRNKVLGYTLIEIIIVMAIVALLAAVAVPSYQGQIQKSRRGDALAAVTAAAAAQERWYFQISGYSDSVDNIGGTGGSLISPEGYYSVTVANNSGVGNCVGGGTVAYNCFTLTATAVAGKTQANDDDCASFSMTQLGERTALDSASNDATSQCW